jgi:hypothetical protein
VHLLRTTVMRGTSSPASKGEATLTGFEPASKISQCCAIPSQICGRLRVKTENANRPVCTNRAELRSSIVRICPKAGFGLLADFLFRYEMGLSTQNPNRSHRSAKPIEPWAVVPRGNSVSRDTECFGNPGFGVTGGECVDDALLNHQ